MNIEIANKLLELRKKSGLSQEELAEKLGISRQSVSKWERAEASPDTDNLIALAQIYNVSLDDLLLGREGAAKSEPGPEKEEDKAKKTSRVHIGLDGIEVHDEDKNEYVNISWNGIHINEDGASKVVVEDGRVFVNGKEVVNDSEYVKRKRRTKFLRRLPFALIVTAAFLLLGFFAGAWYWAWILFLLIPVYSSIISCIEKSSLRPLAFPIIVTAAYLTLGMVWGLWHPWWILFLLIPLWYSILPKRKNKHGINIECRDDDDEDDDDDDDDDWDVDPIVEIKVSGSESPDNN